MTTAPLVEHTVAPGEIVTAFFDAIRSHDVDAAFTLVSPMVNAEIRPVELSGGYDDAHGFFEAALTAFPDLLLRARETVEFPDGRVLSELIFEGTQSAEFLGILNQEKHIDIEQAWLMEVSGGEIVAINGYWDQNKLYRRLAVKRLDQVSIAS
jgi:predicted ester cyclase